MNTFFGSQLLISMMELPSISELEEPFDSALAHGIKSEISCSVLEDNKFEIGDYKLLPTITYQQNYEIKQETDYKEVDVHNIVLEEYPIVKQEINDTENELNYIFFDGNCKVKREIEYKESVICHITLEDSSHNTSSKLQEEQIRIKKSCVVLRRLPFVWAFNKLLCVSPGCHMSFYNLKQLALHLLLHEKNLSISSVSGNQNVNLSSSLDINSNEKHHVGCLYSESIVEKAHLKMHSGEKIYKCTMCSKSFAHNSTLKQHVVIHTGEKLYKCNVCSISFAHNSNLNKHLLIHSDEKLHKCEVCSKSFARKSYLKQHSKIHTGEKLYKCNVCGKSFSHISNLNKHLVIHTGEKLYKCNQCNKSFTQNSHLKRHLMIHCDYRQ